MAIPLVSHFLTLLQAACFIVLAAYLITRSSIFARAMEGRASSKDILIFITDSHPVLRRAFGLRVSHIHTALCGSTAI